ncbi:DUF4062 domain-containing protein [Achromobacter marplatensis]|uniref:DUF4062 domain-containing protein n=1 Tax=Achromobacter marplatensis TaxID=470868 RepID=A0AA43B2D1_9BURK|nr:DUF4062 domain-containing protein [Achromobacter marplatensis]MDH2052865.1 DUF4062 domain-containing protein [Achromobacter marplatensis]
MKKYQVFVSSTFDDLQKERAQVIKAILEMGHIPVGMEMFSAGDDEQWKVIARQIDETDYYVVVVGHRYGSITGGISYTEKEFDYAVSKGIPILGFVIDSSIEPLAKHTDREDEKIAALRKFKAKVKERPVGFWQSADDLHGKVSIALMKAFNTNPRVGWSRTSTVAGPEVMLELSRLSRENAELRAQLDIAKKQEVSDHRLHIQQRIDTLSAIPITLAIREKGKTTWDVIAKTNLFKVFSQIGPDMLDESSVTHASSYLALMNKPKPELLLSPTAPIGHNHIKALFADFASLDLVQPSKKKHPVSDKDSYWSLTQEGIDVLKLSRAQRLERTSAANIEAAMEAEETLPAP